MQIQQEHPKEANRLFFIDNDSMVLMPLSQDNDETTILQ